MRRRCSRQVDGTCSLPGANQIRIQQELKATPVPIRTLPRGVALRNMQDDINSYRPPSKESPHYRQTFDDGRRRFSSQPLSKLKQISISQLSVPCLHEGTRNSPSARSQLISISRQISLLSCCLQYQTYGILCVVSVSRNGKHRLAYSLHIQLDR